MTADDSLSAVQFEHSMTKAAQPHHHIDIMHGGQSIGWLRWAAQESEHFQPGEISALRVAPSYRRQGIASAALNAAQAYDPPPVHSGRRTKSGDAWAQAQGAGPAEQIIKGEDD